MNAPRGWTNQLERLLPSDAPGVVLLVLQPLLTVAMLLFLYAGWHVRDEGSVEAGLRVAFVDTRAFRTKTMHDEEADKLQHELRNAAEADRRIDGLLAGLLARTPLAARVRLSVVHNGITGITGVALLRYDITNAVAAPGQAAGPMVLNQPLSDWVSFLPVLLTGRCFLGLASTEPTATIRARLESMGAGTFMACPVVDSRERMLGALLITWSTRDLPPTGEQLLSLMRETLSTGTQIGTALDMRSKLSPYAGSSAALE